MDRCSKRFGNPKTATNTVLRGVRFGGKLFIGAGSTEPHRLFDFVFAFDRHAASNSAGIKASNAE